MPTSKNLLRSLRRASRLRAVNFLLAGQERHLKERHQRPALPFRCGTASKKQKPGAVGPNTRRPVRLATSTRNSAPSPLRARRSKASSAGYLRLAEQALTRFYNHRPTSRTRNSSRPPQLAASSL